MTWSDHFKTKDIIICTSPVLWCQIYWAINQRAEVLLQPFTPIKPNTNLDQAPCLCQSFRSDRAVIVGTFLPVTPHCPVSSVISGLIIRPPSAPLKLELVHPEVDQCVPYLIQTVVQSCPVIITESSHTISSCYWCSRINTGAVALCHTRSLPVEVERERVTPHLLSDALCPCSTRPFWKNAACIHTHTHNRPVV